VFESFMLFLYFNALKRKLLRFKVEVKAQKCYNDEKEQEVSS